MKTLKLLVALLISGAFFSSCTVFVEDAVFVREVPLENIVSGYDLWYVDYHRTSGNGDIPFVSKAFTLSFINGILYANNNIVDVGRTGNGFGIDVGTYNAFNGVLETNHDLDGFNDFEITVLSNNEIRLYNYRQNVNYFLIGYQINEFDYDRLFYENIEYFLQEYNAWEKINTKGGVLNPFDNENYLAFTPENSTTFYSSQNNLGTQIARINWSYVGGYQVFDVNGYQDLKILTLNYDGGDIEEFELTVLNDGNIELYHINSETTYQFLGRGFIRYLKEKGTKDAAENSVKNDGRKRTKIARETKNRRKLK